MKIVRQEANPNGSRPPLQSWMHSSPPEGYLIFPYELEAEFESAKGFVNLVVDGDTVTSITVNEEALSEWNSEHNSPVENTELEDGIRAERDRLLTATDWTQCLDAPLDKETVIAYRAYRQELRNVPEQDGFPESVVWPEMPEYIKAEPDPVDTAFDELIGGDE